MDDLLFADLQADMDNDIATGRVNSEDLETEAIMQDLDQMTQESEEVHTQGNTIMANLDDQLIEAQDILIDAINNDASSDVIDQALNDLRTINDAYEEHEQDD